MTSWATRRTRAPKAGLRTSILGSRRTGRDRTSNRHRRRSGARGRDNLGGSLGLNAGSRHVISPRSRRSVRSPRLGNASVYRSRSASENESVRVAPTHSAGRSNQPACARRPSSGGGRDLEDVGVPTTQRLSGLTDRASKARGWGRLHAASRSKTLRVCCGCGSGDDAPSHGRPPWLAAPPDGDQIHYVGNEVFEPIRRDPWGAWVSA